MQPIRRNAVLLLALLVGGGCIRTTSGKWSKVDVPAKAELEGTKGSGADFTSDLRKSSNQLPGETDIGPLSPADPFAEDPLAPTGKEVAAAKLPAASAQEIAELSRMSRIGRPGKFEVDAAMSSEKDPTIKPDPPTLGGRQFWADELFFHDWRIQRYALNGSYRLLDGSNRRYASGTFDECVRVLDEIKRQKSLPPMQGKAVILLHGLLRSSGSMEKMANYLHAQGGYSVFNVEYPSTQAEIESHARGLGRIIEHLDGIEEINFVAHSLGNVVIRRYLYEQSNSADSTTDPRIKRIVMLGPPNNGAVLASTLGRMMVFRLIAGSPGQELGLGFEQLQSRLATPQCEFGIIAGGRGDDRGFNPILPGDDDLIVSVAETRLPGALDFLLVPVIHTFLPDSTVVQESTLRFFQHGYFTSAESRQAISTEESTARESTPEKSATAKSNSAEK